MPRRNQHTEGLTNETTPGGEEPVQWEEVAQTAGLLQATIIAGRLEAEGIPTRVWQEGAGQAIGLTVGVLGVGHVLVPEAEAERARQLLAVDDDDATWDNEAADEEEE